MFNAWTMTGKLVAYDVATRYYFGHSLKFYNNILVIGSDGTKYTPQIDYTGQSYYYHCCHLSFSLFFFLLFLSQ